MILLVADMQDLKANPGSSRHGHGARSASSIADAVRWPRCWFATERCTSAIISSAARCSAKCAPCSTIAASRCAKPSRPCRSKCWVSDSLPEVGDTFQVVTDTAKAKQIVIYREAKARDVAMSKTGRMTLEQLHEQLKEGEVKELNIILKTDVSGTAEVLSRHDAEAFERQGPDPRAARAASAPSTKATCCWRRLRTPSSSASTCGRSATPPRWPSRKRSTSACTPSFTS